MKENKFECHLKTKTNESSSVPLKYWFIHHHVWRRERERERRKFHIHITFCHIRGSKSRLIYIFLHAKFAQPESFLSSSESGKAGWMIFLVASNISFINKKYEHEKLSPGGAYQQYTTGKLRNQIFLSNTHAPYKLSIIFCFIKIYAIKK